MRHPRLRTFILAAAILAATPSAQDRSKPWYAMDYGPCLATTIEGFSPDNVALKGRAIFLGGDAGVVFDTELLRVATAWTGGYLELRGTPFDGAHGPSPKVSGDEVCSTKQAPGFAKGGSFADPRPIPYGPLPRDWARFTGQYYYGDRVVLACEAGGRKTYVTFDLVPAEGDAGPAICATYDFGPGQALDMVLLDLPVGSAVGSGGGRNAVVRWKRGDREHATAVLLPKSEATSVATLRQDGGRVEMSVAAAERSTRVQVLFGTTAVGAGLHVAAVAVPPLAEMIGGGPRRYPETIVTKGTLGKGDGPFVVDTITVPAENPWHSWLRFAAFDFVDEDTAALSTWSGDVWLVKGVDGDLGELTWSRFCTGLHDPLGLEVVDGTIYTHGRDGIYKLHDLNGDGGCDYIETFNNDVLITQGFHEFAFDLQTDAAGNFYFAKAGPVNPGGRGFQKLVPHHGTVMKVSKDGSKLEVVATGLRAPNGIGVSADGVITSGDNQGTWTPACRLNISTNGTFWGCVDTAHRDPAPTMYDQPICFLPMDVDNSSGGQVWVPKGTWGPLGGMLLHQSYGQCNVYAVLQQEGGGRVQGGVVKIPAEFASSQMRGRFHGGDLYTCGFKGWQTRASAETAFQRVRRTQASLHMPIGMKVTTAGIELTFSDALDRDTAEDPESYGVEIWNYAWTEAYGSPEFKPSDPTKKVREGEKNRDTLKVTGAKLGADGKTVTLDVDGMREVMQVRTTYSVDAAAGGVIEGEIHGTIHFLPKRG